MTDKLIKLLPYTSRKCHELYQNYLPDQLMTYDMFEYSKSKVDAYYEKKVKSKTRKYFAIDFAGVTIGEIQLKYISSDRRHATLSIILASDEFKGNGYGTEAIKLILDYAKNKLGLDVVYADAVHRNTRSQHVLEKIGFKHLRDDDILTYYEYRF